MSVDSIHSFLAMAFVASWLLIAQAAVWRSRSTAHVEWDSPMNRPAARYRLPSGDSDAPRNRVQLADPPHPRVSGPVERTTPVGRSDEAEVARRAG